MTANAAAEPWTLTGQRPGPSGWITIQTNLYRLPDGSDAEWDLIVGRDGVGVVALTTDQRVVLARQYRPGPDAVLAELPGGYIEPGESPAAAAKRELEEETGYCGDITIVGQTFLRAIDTRRHWIAVAVNCVQLSAPRNDPGEFCQTITMTLSEFRDHLRSGQLTDLGLAYMGLDYVGLLHNRPWP
jgi:ADP-ribose pyrophosphatase